MARKSRKNAVEETQTVVSSSMAYKAAGYIRLSVEDNHKKGDSVETQKAILENYIALAPDVKLHDYYIDNGTTGTNFERPAFKRMLADAESGVINCIIVKDLSRLGRNALDTGYYIEKHLPSINVRFIAINDDFDTNSDMDNGVSVMLPLKNIINEAYALDIGRKIKSQQQQAMKSGEFVGARPPYGYVKAPDNCHKLIVDPEAAEVVKKIYQWAYEGVGLNEIVLRLNAEHIEPPNIYSQRKGIINFRNLRSSNVWTTFSVNRIILDEAYVGDMVQGKSQIIDHKQVKTSPDKWITVQNTHEPLVSREIWAAVHEHRGQVYAEAKARTVEPYTENIFKGKIFCGHCGSPLHRQRNKRKKSDDVFLFHCLTNTRKTRGACETYSITEKDLLSALLSLIAKHSEAITGKALRLRQKSSEVETRRDSVKSELSALRLEADKTGRMQKSLYESLVTGIITPDEYRDMRDGYDAKMQSCLSAISALESEQKELDKQIGGFFELADLLKNAEMNGLTAELIDRLIDRIRVYKDRSIEVDFSFESGFDLIAEVTGDE